VAITEKAGFLASFEMFSALRAGLAGEVRAGSDFKASATVFYGWDAWIGWF
jgi:hypothetical protein